MTCSKTVSVVIPAFNRARVVLRAVNSARNQTYLVHEIIVVDDCSTDGTAELVEAVDDPRVRVIRNEVNSGACKSRNVGIKAATGEYIALLDSDDEWFPEKIEKQMSALDSSTADVCTCRFRRIYTESSCDFGDSDDVYPLCSSGFMARETLVERSLVSTQTILAKREVFKCFRFDEEMPRMQDYEWTIRASGSCSFFLVDDVLVNVFLQDDSISSTGLLKLNQAYEMILDKHQATLHDDPVLLSYLYIRTGRSRARAGINPASCYKAALSLHFNLKTALKLCVARVGIFR